MPEMDRHTRCWNGVPRRAKGSSGTLAGSSSHAWMAVAVRWASSLRGGLSGVPGGRKQSSSISSSARQMPKGPNGSARTASHSLVTRLLAYLAIAEHDPFLAGQALQPDRAAGVDLVGRDADLGPQAVFEAVREAGRGV